MSTVGENILAIRKQLGWTQEELANKMGYKSKSSINKIELGLNDIPQSKIAQFAKVLGVSPARLMGWEEDTSINSKNLPNDEKALTEGEKAMLDLFRRVPEDKQQLVLQMIRAALGNQ